MAIDPTALTEPQALQLIGLSRDPLADFNPADRTIGTDTFGAVVRKYLSGDHWQDGAGWIGPTGIAPATASNAGQVDADMTALIRARFISRNMILDVMQRHAQGVVGREPVWGFTVARPLDDDEQPTEAEQKQLDAVEAAMTTWWDRRKIHKMLHRLSNETLGSGRVVLRLFVPSGRLVNLASDVQQPATTGDGPQLVADDAIEPAPPEFGVVAESIADALEHIFVELFIAEEGAVYTDPDTMEQIGIVVYQRIGSIIGAAGRRIVELTYLDGTPETPQSERETIIRIIGQEEGDASSVAFELGGRLTHYAIEREPMVTDQMISLQKALNFCLTMLSRNEEMNSFLERILSNIQMPGEWELDAAGERTGKFIVGSYVTGPSQTNVLQGAEVVDAAGNTDLKDPKVDFRPPIDNSGTRATIEEFRSEILLEAKQGHLLSTAQPLSGFSRVQTRADFEKSLSDSKAVIDPAGRWLLETVITLGQSFANDPEIGDVSELRAEFACVLDSGPLDPSEVTNVLTAVEKGIASREFGMQALAIEDTLAERARINAEPGKDNQIRQAKAATLKAFTDAGLSMGAAAKLAGFEDKEIKIIEADELANPVPAPAPGGMIPKIDPATGQPMIDPVTKQPIMMPDPNAKPAVPPQNGGVQPPPDVAAAAAARKQQRAGNQPPASAA